MKGFSIYVHGALLKLHVPLDQDKKYNTFCTICY